MEVVNSDFSENDVLNVAGIMCNKCKEVEFTNSRFSKNRVQNVGSIHLKDSTKSALFFNNTFEDNVASNEVGAVKVDRYTNLTFDNNLFLRNRAGRVAGGLYLACCEMGEYSISQGICEADQQNTSSSQNC